MTQVRRINLYGGPGSGKSTAAHFLMWKLKSSGIQADLSREWIKRLAFRGTSLERCFLQPVACGAQLDEELQAIATGAVVVTDSPILLQAAYAELVVDRQRSMVTAQELDSRHPGLHIFLRREGRTFASEGRWQTLEEAKVKDKEILGLLVESGFRYLELPHDSWDTLWRIAATYIASFTELPSQAELDRWLAAEYG